MIFSYPTKKQADVTSFAKNLITICNCPIPAFCVSHENKNRCNIKLWNKQNTDQVSIKLRVSHASNNTVRNRAYKYQVTSKITQLQKLGKRTIAVCYFFPLYSYLRQLLTHVTFCSFPNGFCIGPSCLENKNQWHWTLYYFVCLSPEKVWTSGQCNFPLV